MSRATKETMFAAACALASFLAMVFVLISAAIARDNGQYGDVPQHTRDWIRTLKTPLTPNSTCCDIADGNRDILWKSEGGNYRVQVAGVWLPVPPEAVITEPNRLGYAVVWTRPGDRGEQVVKCFIPGAML